MFINIIKDIGIYRLPQTFLCAGSCSIMWPRDPSLPRLP